MKTKEFNYQVGDKVKIVIDETIYKGEVLEIDDDGFWLTENKETEEYIAFADLDAEGVTGL